MAYSIPVSTLVGAGIGALVGMGVYALAKENGASATTARVYSTLAGLAGTATSMITGLAVNAVLGDPIGGAYTIGTHLAVAPELLWTVQTI